MGGRRLGGGRLAVLGAAVLGLGVACGEPEDSEDGATAAEATGGATGGSATGGSATGGRATGGANLAGAATGGLATGGAHSGGGPSTDGGGAATGGAGPGGRPSTGGGGAATGGADTGGVESTGGSETGGGAGTSLSGGAATGGVESTGGGAAGGSETGGSETGGRETGGSEMGGEPGGGAAGSPSGGSDILEPERGALLGLYYGDESIDATSAKLGRPLPLHLTYYDFDDDWTRGPPRDDLDAGRIPFVNWEVFSASLADIVAGDYDAMLATRAADARDLGAKFFVDFGAEMNGDWSPWGGAQNGGSADLYLAAYRHVHDAMVEGGATNLVWAWCPNVTDEPREAWNAALNYYPGDDYVDWTCVDGYNWGTTNGGGWQSFVEVFEDIYPLLAGKGKPIVIGEMASTELGGDKGAWIDGIVPALQGEFPLIKALLWFDVDKETDWRISSSSASEAAFVRMANDPYFNP